MTPALFFSFRLTPLQGGPGPTGEVWKQSGKNKAGVARGRSLCWVPGMALSSLPPASGRL